MRCRRRRAGRDPARLTVSLSRRTGQAAARNRVLPLARGRWLIALNDDTIPDAGLVASHVMAQRERPLDLPPAIVVGRTTWVVREPDTFFARLLRETSMVFFQDAMDRDPDPGRDWGFRHAWLINLSVPTAVARELGGWTVFPCTYGYEDDEFAFRAARRFGSPVLYRPAAHARHDHPMTPREYLEREYRLGYAALGFAGASPECARAMFGRDVASEGERAYCREFVARERGDASRVLPAFEAWGGVPAGAAPAGSEWVRAAYHQHLPLKRWAWRSGLLAAFEGRGMEPASALALLA
jgi:hypothetical protein